LAGSGRRSGHIFACAEDATSKNVKVNCSVGAPGVEVRLRQKSYYLFEFGIAASQATHRELESYGPCPIEVL
jgi:hypothetical protein